MRFNRSERQLVGRCLAGVAYPAVILLLLATSTQAQPSRFYFDSNGNLVAQTGEITAPPEIIGQPQDQVVATNELATFSVVVANPQSLTYQWKFNNANLVGATNASLLLENVSQNDQGSYQVVLTNPSGSVTSAPAMLWIDSDADALPDSWELSFATNLNMTATADIDGDGVSNLQEFLDGTDPTDGLSARYRLIVLRDGGAVIKTLDQLSYTNGEPVTLTAVASPGGEHFHAWLGDIVTRSNPVTIVMTTNMTIYARFTPVTFTWINTGGGDWVNASNWIPRLVPGSNDTVFITNNAPVTLGVPADCADFVLGGNAGAPTLSGAGTLTVRSNFSWRGGTMSGTGRTVLASGATLTVGELLPVNLQSRTLENGGTVLWTGASSATMFSGAIITNRPGALFHVQNAATLASSGSGIRFDNAGTFRKSVHAGVFTLGSSVAGSTISFNNSGTLEIESGSLLCNGPFTNQGTVHLLSGTTHQLSGGGSAVGTFDASSGALVEWTVGTFSLDAGAHLNGGGRYKINGATVTRTADLVVENLDLALGTLSVTGQLSIASQLNWTGGTMSGSGRTIVEAAAVIDVPASTAAVLSGRTLENGGTAVWQGVGNFALNLGAVVTNRAGALCDVRNASSLQANLGVGRFDNAGTFRKSASSGTVSFSSNVGFRNSGTVEVEAGTLFCNGGFTNDGTVILSSGTTNRLGAGGSAVGTFTAPSGAIVEWSSGAFTLNPGVQLNGAGLYRINSGTVVANANVNVANLDLLAGTLDGPGLVTIDNMMNWAGGSMTGNGRTVIPTGATLNAAIPSFAILTSRTLENGGAVLLSGAGILAVTSGAVITNRAGAQFNVANESAGGLGGASANGRFDNAGTFCKTSGIGTTTLASGFTFNNSGTVDIRSGIIMANGSFISTSNALLNFALGGTVAGTNYGQLKISGAVTLNGSLSVDLLPGFTPALNDTFTVVSAGARSGSFVSFSYPSNVVTMQLSNSATSVSVRVTDLLTSILQPTLLAPEISGTDFRLTWSSTSNQTYRVEFSPSLTPSNWNALPGDVTASSNTASKLDPLTSSNRFYRVRLLP